MTIWAENDTKGAAKQVLTLFFGEHPTLGGTEAKRTRNRGHLQKKRTGPEFPTQSVSEIQVLVSSSVPFLFTKIW